MNRDRIERRVTNLKKNINYEILRYTLPNNPTNLPKSTKTLEKQAYLQTFLLGNQPNITQHDPTKWQF